MLFDDRNRRQEQIIKLLMDKGWKRTDILVEPSYSVDGKLYRPDLILLYNNYPIAVIEIALSENDDLSDAQAQASYYLDSIDMPLAYVIGHQQITEIQPRLDISVMYETFPSPNNLLKKLSIQSNNPLIFPLPQMEKIVPGLHQIFAIRNVIRAVLNGQKRVLFSIAVGGGATYIQAQIVGKLLRSGKYRRALYLGDRLVLLEQTQRAFQEWGFATQKIDNVTERDPEKEIHFQTLQSLSRGIKNPDLSSYDLVIFDDASLATKMNSLQELLSKATIIGQTHLVRFTPRVSEFYGPYAYIFSVQDVLSTEEVKPREGYNKIQLSDIGEIVSGVPYRSDYFIEKNSTQKPFILLRGKDIDSSGVVNLASAVGIKPDIDTRFIKDGQIRERYQLQKGDILVQSIASGNHWNVAILDKDPGVPTTFSGSLIRIRVNSNSVRPEDVYNYLRSTEGQEMLRMLAIRGTSIPRISPRDLINFALFLPQQGRKSSDLQKKDENVIEIIREKIGTILDQAESSIHPEDNLEAINERLSVVSEQIISTVANLTPPSIHDIVMDSFPTPMLSPIAGFMTRVLMYMNNS